MMDGSVIASFRPVRAASAVRRGLLVATVLTLLVVPALYSLWFRVRENEPMAELPREVDARAELAMRIAAE